MINELFKDHSKELLELLNYLKVGVYITNGKGCTILVNDESCRTGGLTRQEITGRFMQDLEREGYVKESITLKTLKSKKSETMVQALGDGGECIAISQPVFENGKLQYVIITERDATEAKNLRDLLEKNEEKTLQYEEEIRHLLNRDIKKFENVIAADEKSKAKVEQIQRIAALNTTVLLLGESGTGKEVYANLLYKNSKRVNKPFVKVNCAAIPENLLESEMFGYEKGAFTGAEKKGKRGYFELASGGTLFLDEISEMPIHLQPKLLRALQEHEIMRIGGQDSIKVDVRLIAATNIDLLQAVNDGKFRKDLYYRVAVMPIEIPPLRERPKDIRALALYFTDECNRKYKVNKKISQKAIEALENYKWPGNVRELQNIIERSVISFDGDEITGFQIERMLYPKIDYPDFINLENGDKTFDELISSYEEQLILSALRRSKNASEAAKILHINKSTMSRKMAKHKINY